MTSKLNDFALLIFRVLISTFMIYGHGYGKLTKLLGGGEIQFYDPFGLGVTFSFVLAVLAEFLAAVFVMLGVFTRLSSLALIITMFIAGFMYHADDPFGSKETAFIYLVSYLLLFLVGPGKYSLQSLIPYNSSERKGFLRFVLR